MPNIVPLIFFYPDYVHPVVQGTLESVCLTSAQGTPSKWHRTDAMIKDDADLAEKKGAYTKPSEMQIAIPGTGLRFDNPFKAKQWSNYDKEVPQRRKAFE